MYDRNDNDPRNDNGPRNGGSGISGRLIGAVIIVLIGLFSYWSHSEQNPVTGEKQHVAISPAQEIRLGLQSAPEMARKMGGEVPDTDPRSIEVKKIGASIVAGTVAKNSPWKFQFHLLADPKTVNAFALPGGQIFITEGLLDKLQTEAQLAGVLSHEMGHVIERHSAQQMAKSQLGDVLVGAVAVAATDPNHPTTSPAMVAAVVNHMFQLRYSRNDEAQADSWGVKLMLEMGYDPRAMIQVMEILKASEGSGHTLEMFQTHPDPDHRIKLINEYLEKHPPGPNLKQGRNLKDLWTH